MGNRADGLDLHVGHRLVVRQDILQRRHVRQQCILVSDRGRDNVIQHEIAQNTGFNLQLLQINFILDLETRFQLPFTQYPVVHEQPFGLLRAISF